MRRLFTGGVIGILAAVMVVMASSRTAHADPRDFTLINGHPTVTLTQVYVSPSSQQDWGDDVLGQAVLAPGESVFIYFTRFTPDSCAYDIRVTYQDGEEGYLYNVDLCSTDTVTFS